MFNANKFKLGLFAPNCSGGLTMTKAPERWDASWENNVTAAQLADDAGLEFVLPVGRWHGYRGETDTEGTSFETLTWACGLLALTREICVFGTLHVAFINPVFAAKQVVTADHIGRGRFGLNVVSGWNSGEFKMFGITLKEHERRYAYTEEWLNIVKRIWTEAAPFDASGENFKLEAVEGKPKPYFDTYPMLISAGNSADGRAFALRHADCLFTTVTRREVAGRRDRRYSLDPDREIERRHHLRQRPSHLPPDPQGGRGILSLYRSRDGRLGSRGACGGDQDPRPRDAIDDDAAPQGADDQRTWYLPDRWQLRRGRRDFQMDERSRVNGMAIGLVNYINDLPALRDEVLPRMARLDLREEPHASAHQRPRAAG